MRVWTWILMAVTALAVLSPRAAWADSAMTYDGANRLAKTVKDGQVTTYGYDGEGNLVRECTGPNEASLVCTDLFQDASALPRVVGKVSGGNETLHAYGPAGFAAQRAVVSGTGQDVEYALTDHQGTVRGTVTSSGAVSARTSYDAYGAVRAQAGTPPSLGYTGEHTGPDGVVNLRARSYLPEIGRFPQRDTLTLGGDTTQGLNRYAYVANNAVNFTDPTGHNPLSPRFPQTTIHPEALKKRIADFFAPRGGGNLPLSILFGLNAKGAEWFWQQDGKALEALWRHIHNDSLRRTSMPRGESTIRFSHKEFEQVAPGFTVRSGWRPGYEAFRARFGKDCSTKERYVIPLGNPITGSSELRLDNLNCRAGKCTADVSLYDSFDWNGREKGSEQSLWDYWRRELPTALGRIISDNEPTLHITSEPRKIQFHDNTTSLGEALREIRLLVDDD